jgi:hypothetical protein
MTITLNCKGTVPVGCDPAVDAAIARMNAATTDSDLDAGISDAERTAAAQRMYIGMVEVGTAYVGDANVPSDYSVGDMYESFNTRGLALSGN